MPAADSNMRQAAPGAEVLDGFEHRRAIAEARQRLFGSAPIPRIGRYRIERRLGAGGMGEVYLGHDEELDRKVAIKRVLASFTSEREQARLRGEARALAKLSHANVVQVYEIGEHEQRTFLAMEFVDGQTLAAWLAERPRSWQAVLTRFLAAGRGLAAAHQAGVIHRDFKPDNVLLGREGSVRVADFGLALAGERRPAGEAGVTADLERRMSVTGSIAGTIRYMAIEQLLGETVDARSDQFSFCVALYEALWADQPFSSASLEARLAALESDQPTPPGRSSAPRGLWRVVRRGLSRAPADRWPDMSTLLAALEVLPRRRRWAIATLIVLPCVAAFLGGRAMIEARERAEVQASCAAAGRDLERDWNDEVRLELERAFESTGLEFASTTWALTRERMDAFAREWSEQSEATCVETELEHTRTPASREQVDECLAEARATFVALASTWTDADEAMVIHATMAVAGLPVLSSCRDGSWLVGRAQAGAEIEPRVAELRMRLERVKALRMAVQFDRGLAEALAVLAEAEALGWRPLLAESRLAIGELQDRVGRYPEARATLHQAFIDATASGSDFTALRASIALTLVEGARLDRPERGLEWGALAKALLERLDLLGSMHEASTLHAIGRAQRGAGDLSGALVTQRRVLALDEAVHGPYHPDNAISLNAIGGLQRSLGRLDEARAAHERALQIQRRTLGRDHPDVANTLLGLAYVAEAGGELDRALELASEAQRLERNALGPDHLYVAQTHDALAAMRIRRGDLADALADRQRALAIREAELGPLDVSVGWSKIRLADALLSLDRPALALEHFEQALAIFEAAPTSEVSAIAAASSGIGHSQFRLARFAEAEQALARSLSLAELGEVPAGPIADTRFVYAQVLWALGRRTQARDQALLARSAWLAPGGGSESTLAELDAWLREHP
ncbi:protein kinase domain-containing protein [Nannocystaceae bacterium ST9]